MPFSETYVLTPEGGKRLHRLQQKSFRAISKTDLVDLYILTFLSDGEARMEALQRAYEGDPQIIASRVKKLRTSGQLDWADNRRNIGPW